MPTSDHNTTSSNEFISKEERVNYTGIEFLGGQERTNYPCVLSVEDFGDALGLTAQILQPIDPVRICGYMEQALVSLMLALETDSQTAVSQLEVVPTEERALLLQTWNATDALYPDQVCIHTLFEDQATKTPEAVALVNDVGTLSYSDLNAYADRLACQLSRSGVQPGDIVGILLERSFELVAAQLAILKVGAAYVPIDPKAPVERQAYIIRDTAARLLITGDNTIVLDDFEVPFFRVNLASMDASASSSEPKDLIQCTAIRSSREVAYVMYTSGSTGMPKGVVVPHRVISRLVINNGYAEIGPDDRVAFAANPAFDASTFEV
ncbi:hypothetical protein EC968_005843 [Mortierella alpina]|nr:hypothetical protein EC968_005843 [Mortierella alpina]